MSTKPYILIVDDDSMSQMILTDTLSDDYDLICVDDGQSCLQKVNKRTPELILLDVDMPEFNGLQVCKKLRSDEQSADIPIIFVSGMISDEDKLAGYKAGGDDYVTKPFIFQELSQKIKLLIEQHDEKIKLKQSFNETNDAFMTSLTISGEIGEIISFTRQSHSCNTVDQLITTLFESMKAYGLAGSILLTAFDKVRISFSDGLDRPLEKDVLLAINADPEHIITFSNHIAFNSNIRTLLVRNLPDDNEMIGRLRDHLATLMDSFDARLEGIKTEMENLAHQQELKDIMLDVKEKIVLIDEQTQSHKEKNAHIMTLMASEIEDAFTSLDLSAQQEDTIHEIILRAEKETDELFNQSLSMDKQFSSILDKLNP